MCEEIYVLLKQDDENKKIYLEKRTFALNSNEAKNARKQLSNIYIKAYTEHYHVYDEKGNFVNEYIALLPELKELFNKKEEKVNIKDESEYNNEKNESSEYVSKLPNQIYPIEEYTELKNTTQK